MQHATCTSRRGGAQLEKSALDACASNRWAESTPAASSRSWGNMLLLLSYSQVYSLEPKPFQLAGKVKERV